MKEAVKNKTALSNAVKVKDFFLKDRLLSFMILISFIVFYISVVFISGSGLLSAGVRLSDYEAGKVAEKDIVVERDLEYEDKKATELKREAQALLVEPVFRVAESITERVLISYNKFIELYSTLIKQEKSSSEIYLEIQSELPGYLTENQIADYLKVEDYPARLDETGNILENIMTDGVIGFPDNLRITVDTIEVLKWSNGEKVTEKIRIENAITLENLQEQVESQLQADLQDEDRYMILSLLSVFAEENTFYDSDQTDAKRLRAREQVEPVIKKIVKDEVIVKRGFIITEEDMIKIEALGSYSDNLNFSILIGKFFCCCSYFL